MSDSEMIVSAFAWSRETGYATVAPHSVELHISAGQDFVRIALMPDIPDKLVGSDVKRSQESYGQFDYTEWSAEMPPMIRYNADYPVSDFVTELRKLIIRQGFDILGRLDSGKQT
jgi:hypothetical protein